MTAGVVTYPNYPGHAFAVVDNQGAVIAQFAPGSLHGSLATASMSNSTSLTLSSAFTALTFTQTSTGNTVQLPSSNLNGTPLVHGQLCGFSIDSNVTNLTVSAVSNTVKNGASSNTSSAGSNYWWVFNLPNTTWYRYGGDPLGT